MGLYRLSPRAQLDLDEIADHIAPDNPLRAITFVDRAPIRARLVEVD